MPDSNLTQGDNQELVELLGMAGQDILQAGQSDRQDGVVQAEVDHSRVGLEIAEDQFAEVAIVGNQDPLLSVARVSTRSSRMPGE